MAQAKEDIRVRFRKEGDIRFISHHDLMRVFERAIRRAGIPVALSKGYNPRPRMSFPMALSVGLVGKNEVMDLALRKWVGPRSVQSRLQGALPEGIVVRGAEAIAHNASRSPVALSYRVPLLPEASLTQDTLRSFLARTSVPVLRHRRKKTVEVNVRQFVKHIRLAQGALHVLLLYTQQGTARPQEVMEALGCEEGRDYLAGAIERTNVMLPSPD